MNYQAPILAGLLALQLGVGTMHASQLIDNLNAGKKQTVVAYGTSLTAGGQWVNDLKTWLDERYPGQATVINGGMGGKASNSALAHLDARVIAHKPDVVFLEFAINDASAYYDAGDIDRDISLEKSRANLNQLIDRIRQANPSVEIILQTMNPPWDAPNGNRSASRRPRLADYYEGYRKVATERSLLLVDHHATWSELKKNDRATYERYIPDGVHPAPEGSTAITFAGIKNALSAPTKSVVPAPSSRLIDNLNAGKKQTVVVYGTSLTALGQWVDDLRSWLNDLYPAQVTVINNGLSGQASNKGLAQLYDHVISHHPDTVFIEFSVNDSFQFVPANPDHGITLEKSRANLNRLIDRIRQANPEVEIILQTMNPTYDGPNDHLAGTKRPTLADYYEVYRQVAAERSFLLIDHHASWSDLRKADPEKFKRYIPDGAHPTAEASTAITFQEIKKALGTSYKTAR
jgi:lysophospholipase L1-like esterase